MVILGCFGDHWRQKGSKGEHLITLDFLRILQHDFNAKKRAIFR